MFCILPLDEIASLLLFYLYDYSKKQSHEKEHKKIKNPKDNPRSSCIGNCFRILLLPFLQTDTSDKWYSQIRQNTSGPPGGCMDGSVQS